MTDFPLLRPTILSLIHIYQLKKLREEHLKIQLTISLHAEHNLQEIVLFLTCAYMLLKMLLSKPYPIPVSYTHLDFKGHSLSVSDIVVLHQNDEDTAHYVDSIGFQQVPEFLPVSYTHLPSMGKGV